MMSTLIVQSQWEDEKVRERTRHSPLYAVPKKMKSLSLHIHDFSRASLRDCFSLPLLVKAYEFLISEMVQGTGNCFLYDVSFSSSLDPNP